MGTFLSNIQQKIVMKYLLVIALAIAAVSAQAEKVIECREPDAVYVQPIPVKTKEAAVDLAELQAKIEAINKKIEESKTEAVILDFDEIKEKYGDKLVKKLQKLKEQGKKAKVIKA